MINCMSFSIEYRNGVILRGIANVSPPITMEEFYLLLPVFPLAIMFLIKAEACRRRMCFLARAERRRCMSSSVTRTERPQSSVARAERPQSSIARAERRQEMSFAEIGRELSSIDQHLTNILDPMLREDAMAALAQVHSATYYYYCYRYF